FYFSKMSEIINKISDKYDYEIILIDDGSEDSSFKILQNISKLNPKIKVYSFSRNFGHQKAIWTGYVKAKGNCAIALDCDLQDPPELLFEMLNYWEKGYKIVYGIRKDRKENFIIKNLRKIFYRILSSISNLKIPNDVGDFMLIDKHIIKLISNTKLHNPYLRGSIFSFGFKQKGIEYIRNSRINGTSKYTISKLLQLATNGFINTSVFPLRIATFIGIALGIISFLFSIYIVIDKLFLNSHAARGITLIIILILWIMTINCLLFGLIGEYIGKIYSQISNDKITIIEKKIENGEIKYED
nr:putative glycosyltransferase [Candidatus Anoxychlamydiales bacterium]